MNLSTSQCGTSGCESGWTFYLDQSSYSQTQCQQFDEDYVGKGSRFLVEDEEEGLSMVSDASSGPRHYCCQYYVDENESFCSHATPQPAKKTSKNKKKIKQDCSKHSYLDDTASSPVHHHSYLDDTASSPVHHHSHLDDTASSPVHHHSHLDDTASSPVHHHSHLDDTASSPVISFSEASSTLYSHPICKVLKRKKLQGRNFKEETSQGFSRTNFKKKIGFLKSGKTSSKHAGKKQGMTKG